MATINIALVWWIEALGAKKPPDPRRAAMAGRLAQGLRVH